MTPFIKSAFSEEIARIIYKNPGISLRRLHKQLVSKGSLYLELLFRPVDNLPTDDFIVIQDEYDSLYEHEKDSNCGTYFRPAYSRLSESVKEVAELLEKEGKCKIMVEKEEIYSIRKVTTGIEKQ